MEEQVIQKQRESIKLTRSAKGFYYWEIKILGDIIIPEDDVGRLILIDAELKKKFKTFEDEIKSEGDPK